MSTKKTFLTLAETVDAAGTAQPIATSSLLASHVTIIAAKVTGANTGVVNVGTSAVDKTSSQQVSMDPGDIWEIPLFGDYIDLNELYIDAVNSNDGVIVMYFEGTG